MEINDFISINPANIITREKPTNESGEVNIFGIIMQIELIKDQNLEAFTIQALMTILQIQVHRDLSLLEILQPEI